MSSQFVVTKKTVATVIDGKGPLYSCMSVSTISGRSIELVIGARYDHRCACAFNKIGLGELIDILSEIHEAMEE